MGNHRSILLGLSCLAFLLLPKILLSQDFRRGYIIKNSKDSISGLVKYGAEKKNTAHSVFKEPGKSKVSFSPDDIVAYGFYGDKQYISMEIPSMKGKKVFVKVLSKGPINLYEYRSIFLVKKDSLMELPLPKSKTVETESGMRTRQDNTYKGLLNFLVSDCKMSADDSKYDEKDLTNLINNYNRCKGVEPIYKKPRPIFKMNYSAFAGYTSSNMTMDMFGPVTFNPSKSITGGVAIELSSPRIFDKVLFIVEGWYVKGFYQSYTKTSSGSDVVHSDIIMDFTSIKLPIGFRYNFLKENSTPYIKGGLMVSFLTGSSITTIQERETTAGTVTTSESYGGYDLQKQPKGFWLGIGYNKTMFRNMQMFVEIRYEKGEGFIGTPIQSFSKMKNYNFMLGIRF